MESGRPTRLALSDPVRRRYRESALARRKSLTQAFYRIPLDPVFVQSDKSAVEPLLQLFMSRKIA